MRQGWAAVLYMGGRNERDLLKKYHECVDFHDFQVTDVGEGAETRQLPNADFPIEDSLGGLG